MFDVSFIEQARDFVSVHKKAKKTWSIFNPTEQSWSVNNFLYGRN